MCFSAGVSFASSGVIGGAGIVTVLKTKRLRALAIIPILFAIQQFIEGLQWLAPHPSQLSIFLGYGFLLFAFLLWPVYVPLSVLRIEKGNKRKQALRFFLALGILIAVYLFSAMATQPLTVAVMPRGLEYQIYIPFELVIVYAYIACVCGSLLVSSQVLLRIFAYLVLFSAIVSLLIFQTTFTSTWCFFAAVLSAFLLFGLKWIDT